MRIIPQSENNKYGCGTVAAIEKIVSGDWQIHINIVDTIDDEPLEASVYWSEGRTDQGNIQERIYWTPEKGFYDENGQALYLEMEE